MTFRQLHPELILHVYLFIDIDTKLRFEKALCLEPIRKKIKIDQSLKSPPNLEPFSYVFKHQDDYIFCSGFLYIFKEIKYKLVIYRGGLHFTIKAQFHKDGKEHDFLLSERIGNYLVPNLDATLNI